MKRRLALLYSDGGYYEPTIEIEVVDLDDEKTSKRDFRNYCLCGDSKCLSDFIMENSDDLERYLEIELSVGDLKEIANTWFETLLDNYSFLQELKSNAYKLTTYKNDYVKKYRMHIYSDEGGYGSFRQELIVLETVGLVTLNNTDFKKKIIASLYKDFVGLVPKNAIEQKTNELKVKLENTKMNIERFEREIKQYNTYLKNAKEQEKQIIIELEEMK